MPICGGAYPPFSSVCPPIYLLVLLSVSGFPPLFAFVVGFASYSTSVLILFLVQSGGIFL